MVSPTLLCINLPQVLELRKETLGEGNCTAKRELRPELPTYS